MGRHPCDAANIGGMPPAADLRHMEPAPKIAMLIVILWSVRRGGFVRWVRLRLRAVAWNRHHIADPSQTRLPRYTHSDLAEIGRIAGDAGDPALQECYVLRSFFLAAGNKTLFRISL